MKLIIDVTAEDIRLGVRANGQSCPIALALIRAFEAVDECPIQEVEVEGENITVTCYEEDAYSSPATSWWKGDTPGDAIDFQQVFDVPGDGVAEPFEFELELVQVWE